MLPGFLREGSEILPVPVVDVVLLLPLALRSAKREDLSSLNCEKNDLENCCYILGLPATTNNHCQYYCHASATAKAGMF